MTPRMTDTTTHATTRTATTPVPVGPSRGRLFPLGLDAVRLTDGFWAERQQRNAAATLDHIGYWLEREGWIANFDLAAGGQLPTGRHGREFSDSEVYKYLEALAWEIGRVGPTAATDLEPRFSAIVARVGAAQESDGYLNTNFGRPGQAPRWSDMEWGHELYCAGHLLQAAVARARTRPHAEDGLVAIARRVADLVCTEFGPGGREGICGHPEIEPALAEFGRVTGDARYLQQAARFVARRGHGLLADNAWGRSYSQDDMPVRAATTLRGHAVRAGYLSAGAVDVAVEDGDDELIDALERQWRHTVARRTYLTGGQGSHHQDEAFGEDWELPPDRAYSETCASIASIMFSWRLLLARGHARYADLIERTLYNVVATAVGRDGRSFFYTNTLHQRRPGTPARQDIPAARAESPLRAPWFPVSCCPPNIARTFAALACYVATVDDEGLQLHQYASAEIRTTLPDGRPVAVDVATRYPRDGMVRIRVLTADPDPWTLTVRVPAWAEGAELTITPAQGAGIRQNAPVGSVPVRRRWAEGDTLTLHLPVAARYTKPHPHLDAVRGCIAIERGPEVLCLESVDLATAGAGIDIADVWIDPDTPPVEEGDTVSVCLHTLSSPTTDWPYLPSVEVEEASVIHSALMPYHDWAQRGPSTMRIWLPALHEGT
jgi:uncharacterized protein